MPSKTTWELAVFHICYYCKVIEYKEFNDIGIHLSNKTITRYLDELQAAGLLDVIFSRKDNGYVHINENRRCPFSPPKYTASERQNAHIDRLIRLVTIMLKAEYSELPNYDEDDEQKEDVFIKWYKETFPTMSFRTMYRDFSELNRVGYRIHYYSEGKYYEVDFPYCLEGLEIKE